MVHQEGRVEATNLEESSLNQRRRSSSLKRKAFDIKGKRKDLEICDVPTRGGWGEQTLKKLL